MANVCTFSSSSLEIPDVYFEAAKQWGRLIGVEGHDLVFGGVYRGCMDKVASTAEHYGANVVGVLPFVFRDHAQRMTEAVLAETLHHRKAEMEVRGDAFVALAGGFGTLDELMGLIGTRQVGAHDKPIVIVNTNGFYDDLLSQFDKFIRGGFVKDNGRKKLYHVSRTPQGAMDYINSAIST